MTLREYLTLDLPSRDPVVVHNVALPLYFDENFIPPDLEDAIEYYPQFIAHSGLDWSPQGYFCHLANLAEKAKAGGYTSGDKIMQEFIVYVGLSRFSELMRVSIQ